MVFNFGLLFILLLKNYQNIAALLRYTLLKNTLWLEYPYRYRIFLFEDQFSAVPAACIWINQYVTFAQTAERINGHEANTKYSCIN